MLPQSRSLAVRSVEAVGAYTLLRLWRDGAEAGVPGQFFMLQAEPAPRDAYLPRPISAAWADDEELAFLLDVRGAGHACAGRGGDGRRARAARARVPARSGARDPGRRRDRRGHPPVARAAPSRRPVAARLPHRGACGLRRPDRSGRHGRRRAGARDRAARAAAPGLRGHRLRMRPRRACSARSRRSPPSTGWRASSPWRPRWRAASAPATAAPSRSTVAGSGCASRVPSWRRAVPSLETTFCGVRAADAVRQRVGHARRARLGDARILGVRHQDGHPEPAGGEPAAPDRRDARPGW